MVKSKMISSLDLTNIVDVVYFMAQSYDNLSWNSKCIMIKEANDGGYPDEWIDSVIMRKLEKYDGINYDKYLRVIK